PGFGILATAAENLLATRRAGREVAAIEEVERLLERVAEQEGVLLYQEIELPPPEVEGGLREVIPHARRAAGDLVDGRRGLQEVLEHDDAKIRVALDLSGNHVLVEFVVPHLVLREGADHARQERVARLPGERGGEEGGEALLAH